MTVAEILDANRGPHGWDRSRAESAINDALELAAQAMEAHCEDSDCLCNSNESRANRIRAMKSPAGPVQPSHEQEKSGA